MLQTKKRYAPNRIREMREKRGLSQEALARACNTTNQEIGMLERSERRLTVDWMADIARALDVRMRDLLIEEETDLVRDVAVVSWVEAGAFARRLTPTHPKAHPPCP